jgi:hypothetical protein
MWMVVSRKRLPTPFAPRTTKPNPTAIVLPVLSLGWPLVYILRGSSFFRQLLVVVDRESLDPLRLAESTFLSRRWSPIAPELWHEYLG